MRMWGCKYTSKHAWTSGYEDVRMQAHMNLKIWGCGDARLQISTHELYKDVIWGCKDARIQASTHEP